LEVKPVLNIEKVSVYYGKAIALRDVSLTLGDGEFVTLLGSNGAGKSTLLKTISGLIHPREGRILLDGEEIQDLPPHKIVERGIVHVPEGREVFPELTVRENLWMGSYARKDSEHVKRDLEFVYSIFPRLEERSEQVAGTLSGGEAQMLAIGRGILSSPKVLMLDEPSLGIAPALRDTIFEVVQKIYDERKISCFLVEQNAHIALSMSKRGYIIENGQVKYEGNAQDLMKNEEVKKAYLGY
jgi:branched-chain amino acid transport system ATP-binding protein